MEKALEVIKSSFTLDGQKIFLIFIPETNSFRIGTRWAWLISFETIQSVSDAFEALELLDVEDLKTASAWIKKEMIRVPRTKVFQASAMSYVSELVSNCEKRLSGLAPFYSGSHQSVIRWK
jgi:hypothetical protein